MPPKIVCPVCTYANPHTARRCAACGAVLDDGETTVDFSRPRSALWLDIDPGAVPGTAVPGAQPLVVTLREVVAEPPPKATPATVEEAAELVGDPADKRPVAPAPAPTPAPQRSRAEQRAAVRRAQRRARTAAPQLREVLVFDVDDDGRALLCGWLRTFGFEVRETADPGEAWALVRTRPFAAVFVDVVFDDRDGGAGVELCKLVKAQARERGASTPLVLASHAMSHIERVAAELAGCDEFIDKPVSRGAVARVLDLHGIALPADARGGA